MTDKERRNKMKALIYLERALALDEKHFFFQLIDDETIHVTDIESGNWHTRLIQDCDGVESYKIVRNESRSYEDVLLDYGIDDEDLILSLEALESSANDAMEALFLQTGGGY